MNDQEHALAEQIKTACIKAAREGFTDASMSGLCSDGAMEAAISSIQKLDLKQIVDEFHKDAS